MALFNDYMIERELKYWTRQDAHQFLRPDWRRFWRPGYRDRSALQALRTHRAQVQPEQPRDRDGRWTGEGGAAESQSKPAPNRTVDVQDVLAKARQIVAAGRNGYQKCLDICVPLLERFQPVGSDRNQWDFHKCMGACVGR